MTPDRSGSTSTLYPVDWVVIGYSLLMTAALAILGRPNGSYLDEITFYLGMACLAVLVAHYVDGTAGGWRALVRYVYPAFMFGFFYRATGGHMLLLYDRFFDGQLVSLEQALFGGSPTLYMDSLLPNVWITEITSLCYACYYLMIPSFLLLAFLRKDYRIIRQYLTAAGLTFFVSYLFFWLYPAEGPRWYFAGLYANSLEGPIFRQLVELVMNNAAVRGGAMPSSHTGVALVTMFFGLRYYRRFGWLLVPIVIGLAVGSVWGRFHYVSDVLIGAGIGILAAWLVWKFIDRPESEVRMMEVAAEPRTLDVT